MYQINGKQRESTSYAIVLALMREDTMPPLILVSFGDTC